MHRPGTTHQNKVCQQATAYLESALKIAKTYIAEAHPDTPYMPSALSWYISLAVMHCGPELSEDLRELDVRATYTRICPVR